MFNKNLRFKINISSKCITLYQLSFCFYICATEMDCVYAVRDWNSHRNQYIKSETQAEVKLFNTKFHRARYLKGLREVRFPLSGSFILLFNVPHANIFSWS
jgi:hypothetical protein